MPFDPTRRRWLPAAVCLLLAGTGFAQAAEPPISFSQQIAPILLKRCQNCHGLRKDKGGYRLDHMAVLRQAGKSKLPALTAGKPEASELYMLLVAGSEDDRMPKDADPLPKAQIELIRKWIAQGAPFDGPSDRTTLAEMAPPPVHPKAPESYRSPVPITAMAFVGEGDATRLAIGGFHEVTFWNPQSGTLDRRLGGLPPEIHDLVLSADGKLLAVAGGRAGEYGEVRLFDTSSWQLRRAIGFGNDLPYSLAFSPDGKLLAAAGADRDIRLYDTHTGQTVRRLSGHGDWVLGVNFSPDGKRLASGSRDTTARAFDVATGHMIMTYRDHRQPVHDAAFDPSGKIVLSAGADRVIHLWNIENFKLGEQDRGPEVGKLHGFNGQVLEFHQVDGKLYSIDHNGHCHAHQIDGRRHLRKYEPRTPWTYAVAFHPGRQLVAAGDHDAGVRVWEAESGKKIASFQAIPRAKHAQASQP